MPTMFITGSAARNLIRAYDPDMTVPAAVEILRQSALNATQLDERTDRGDFFYRVADLGGRLVVRGGDPDYGLVAVAYVRDRNRSVEQAVVDVAKSRIRAAMEADQEWDVNAEARRQLRVERHAAHLKEQEDLAE